MKRALVVGYGSIGKRHARVLSQLGCQVAVVSRRANSDIQSYRTIDNALASHEPDYVVVADETARHYVTVSELATAGYQGVVLIEKPLFDRVQQFPPNEFTRAWVGYNLRFHPAVQAVKAIAERSTPLAWQINVGQHLSQWRAGRDFRESYSAKRAGGGGALRDLSHEIDYLLWMAGPPETLVSSGGNLGALGIEADEAWSVILKFPRQQVASLNMNILDHSVQRSIRMVCEERSVFADLAAGQLSVSDGESQTFTMSGDETYRLMHDAALNDDCEHLCSVESATRVLKVIAAAERASTESCWVSLA